MSQSGIKQKEEKHKKNSEHQCALNEMQSCCSEVHENCFVQLILKTTVGAVLDWLNLVWASG